MNAPATAAHRLLPGDKEPVRAATTGNIALSGLLTIDGVTLVAGDRVLVKMQADRTQNGIYNAQEGRWYRSADANNSRALTRGMKVTVQEGAENSGRVYSADIRLPDIGDDDITFSFYLGSDAEQVLRDLYEEILALAGTIVNDILNPESSFITTVSMDLNSAHNRKLVVADDTLDGIGLYLPDAVAVGNRWAVYMMSGGTGSAFETMAIASVAGQTVNGGVSFVQVPRHRIVLAWSDGANWWADDPSNFASGVTFGGQVDPNRYVTIGADGQVISRNDNNGVVGFFKTQNFGITGASQGAVRLIELGAGNVFGAVAYRENLLTTEDWSVPANRSVELNRQITGNGSPILYERVSDAGQVQWPVQRRFSAHKTAATVDVTGNGAAHQVVFGAEDYDVGGGYAIATGVFTAGVAGKYALDVSVGVAQLTSLMVQGVLTLTVSSPAATVTLWDGNPYAIASASAATLRGSIEIAMDAGATAAVSVAVSGGAGNTADIYGHATNHLTRFQGRLLP